MTTAKKAPAKKFLFKKISTGKFVAKKSLAGKVRFKKASAGTFMTKIASASLRGRIPGEIYALRPRKIMSPFPIEPRPAPPPRRLPGKKRS